MRMRNKDMHRIWLVAAGLLCSTAVLAEPLSDEAAMQLLERLNQMESEVSNLRGENEQLRNDLRNLQDKQQEGFQQVDERMEKLNEGTPPPADSAATNNTDNGNVDKTADEAHSAASPDVGNSLSKDDPNSFYSYGTGKSDDKNPPKSDSNASEKPAEKPDDNKAGDEKAADNKASDAASGSNTGNTDADKPASGREERAVYDEAFNTLLKNPKDSIPLFRAFLKDYPDSPLAGSAQYWIGEALYADHDYKAAADEFLLVLKEHKSSDKAPGAALKLGYSFYELKDWDKARKTLEDVISFFPDSADTAAKARERLDRMKSEGH